MIIVADENILDVTDAFQAFGELRLLPGRLIRASDLKDADALVVRSVTRVDEALLGGSQVRFVATATSGQDHLDRDWLARTGVHVADAAGANANAVVEYVIQALCEIHDVQSPDVLARRLQGKRLAVVGAGHVGSRLLRFCTITGIQCVVCDPFLDRLSPRLAHLPRVDLEEALDCELISLHVPLTDEGPHPTRNMLDANRIAALAPGTVLVNTARGEVLDAVALHKRLSQLDDLNVVLDVYPDEPEIDRQLCERLSIATPHIAGYSVEAKQAATQRVLAAFCSYFDLPMFEAFPPGGSGGDPLASGASAVGDGFSPYAVSQAFLEQIRAVPTDQSLAPVFDRMRKDLRARRELGLMRGV